MKLFISHNILETLRTAAAFLLILSCMTSASVASVRAEEQMDHQIVTETEEMQAGMAQTGITQSGATQTGTSKSESTEDDQNSTEETENKTTEESSGAAGSMPETENPSTHTTSSDNMDAEEKNSLSQTQSSKEDPKQIRKIHRKLRLPAGFLPEEK